MAGRRLIQGLTSPWSVGFSAFGLAYGGYHVWDSTQSGSKYDLNEDLSGKTYIVTGATSGIGQATVEELAKRNARVIMACRNREKCVQVRRDIVLNTRNKQVILSKLYTAEGRFTFTSNTPGEHVICIYSNSTAWFNGAQLRVHLDIQAGDHAQDYAQIAQKDKLNELQLRIRQLLDQVDQITKEQNYQRYREERFRQTSESTNSRVFYWSIAQVRI
uniref:GOLD domain-containing protein n=1 Tax=Caenorhabditis japonica TaxID=281687 RepID=A0A8R1ISN8_CAEJA